MSQVKSVPDGVHTITPQLTIDGCDKAIDWYKNAFGAELLVRAPDPSGKKVWHASMRIGDSQFFLNDAFPDMGGGAQPASLWIYADNIDQWWTRVVNAGAKIKMPIGDMFWGDRMGAVVDPFGNQWNLSQHIKDLTPKEMKTAQDAFVASRAKQ